MASPCRPARPAALLTLPTHPSGYYLFGSSDFTVRPLRVANIFHRSFFGTHEDFILGVLSVLLIALLTEICHVLLMRTSRRKVTRSGFHAAFALDELTHFRNVFDHLRHRTRSKVPRSVLWTSLTVILVGGVLIAAEVLAVYITQPFKVYAPGTTYNLRGVQPVLTTDEAAIQIDVLTKKKGCVSPMMPDSNHSREYSIFACVKRSIDNALTGDDSTARFVEIESYFHKAGSDHVLIYGNGNVTGRHVITTRASIMQSALAVSSGIMFDVNTTSLPASVRYLQARAVENAVTKHCERFPSPDCKEQTLDRCSVAKRDTRMKNITLWEVKEETGIETPVIQPVEGIVTRFKLRLWAPGSVLTEAFRVFATSAAIEEVMNGEGMYVSMPHGKEYHSMEGLVSEEGRIAGVVLLGVILVSLLGLLVVLRLIFRPISIARLARNAFEAEDERFWDDDDFIGSSPGISLKSSSVWVLERDIVEPDLDDYASTDMFDLPKDPPPKWAFWKFKSRPGREPD